jgi:hypothetical protein
VRNGTCCRRAIRITKRCIGRFQAWCCDEVLRRVLTDVANELRDRGALNEEECFIDALRPTKGLSNTIGFGPDDRRSTA